MGFSSEPDFKLEITQDYVFAIISALCITIYTAFLGWKVSSLRKKYFNNEFMEKNFGEEHRKAFGDHAKLSYMGYPDHGEGRYSEKLSYEQWYKFNIAQSVHQNSLEHLPMALVTILVCG